ncbi:MAG: sulfotransferase family protein [Burkholderiales bacterium]
MSSADYQHPLIILGSPRSFTSLICAMLGQHPQCYGVPELNLFVAETLKEFIEAFSGYRQIQLHGLIRTVGQLYSGEQTLASLGMVRRWMVPRLEHSIADVYRELCRKAAPLRIVDKSPVYVLYPDYLRRINKVFPNAYFLHLLRNPRTQGESILQIAGGAMAVLSDSVDYSTDPPTVDPQLSWYRAQRNIEEFLKDVSPVRQMRLLGEEMLNDRERHLRAICSWLGIATDDVALDAMLHPERSPFACLGPLGSHLGNDINFLQSPALRPGKVSCPPLAGPLPWRKDGQGLRAEILAMAQRVGYV